MTKTYIYIVRIDLYFKTIHIDSNIQENTIKKILYIRTLEMLSVLEFRVNCRYD